jgi:hypothetical protein
MAAHCRTVRRIMPAVERRRKAFTEAADGAPAYGDFQTKAIKKRSSKIAISSIRRVM